MQRWQCPNYNGILETYRQFPDLKTEILFPTILMILPETLNKVGLDHLPLIYFLNNILIDLAK